MIFDLLSKGSGVRIGSSVELLEEILKGAESEAGVPVSGNRVLRHGVVVALIGVLQRAASQLPLHLYKRDGDYRRRADNHPISRLLVDGPNDLMTTSEWISLLVKDLFADGNHYCFKNKTTRGRILEILPLNYAGVQPKVVDDYDVAYELTMEDGRRDVLTRDEVLQFKVGSRSLVEGISPFVQARDSSGLSMALEKYAGRLFRNAARPSGLLSAPSIGPETVKEIRKEWEDRYSGLDNAHRVAVLTGGLTWTSLSLTSDEAQFIETRRYTRNELAGLVGVPPHMIGGLENATFSNIEHQAIEFVIHALNPILVMIEQRLAKSLLTPQERASGHYFKFNVNAILRGDMKTRGEFYTRMVQNGALSPNELRALEDMNPRDGGDIYLTPMNMNVNGLPPEDGKK